MYINKITLDNVTYNIGPNIENTELTTSTTDVPSTNLMKTLIDGINTQINNAISRISTNETNINKLNAEAVGTITSTMGTLNQAYTRIVKKGSIVWLCLSIRLNKAVEMYGNFAAIPESFRPSGDFFTYATNSSKAIRVWITRDGVIANYSDGSLASGESWQIATCYFT